MIDRLIAQNGKCREVDSNKNNLVFNCDKDGEILITPETDEYSVFLSAKVIRCNSSTKIVADLKKRNSSTGFKILRSFLKFMFIFIAFIYVIIKNAYYTLITADLCILLVAGFTLLSTILSMQSESKKPLYDLEIMKGELIKRIKAIEKWYD